MNNNKAFKLENEFVGKRFQPYLYAAYGMNTSYEEMRRRCPDAEPVGRVLLRNHRLVFRGVADVVWSLGHQTHLALWRITAKCEKALDGLEGFRTDHSGLYDKRYFRIHGAGPLGGQWAMMYVMTSRTYIAPPSEYYEKMLRAGYRNFDMPQSQIDAAKQNAKDGSWMKARASHAAVALRNVASDIVKTAKPKPQSATCGMFCHKPDECEERGKCVLTDADDDDGAEVV